MPIPRRKTLKAVYLSIVILFFSGKYCDAQTSFLTGASLGFLQNIELEKAVQNYNTTNEGQLSKHLKPINSLLGFNLGVRSKYDLIAFEAGITMRFQNSTSEGVNSNNDNYTEKFSLRYNTYYLGTEIFLGSSIISIGGNIGFDKFKIKHSLTGQESNSILDQQNGWSSKFFLGINLEGSGTTKLIVRPFYEMDWTGKKLDNYSERLDFTSTTSLAFNQIGISLIFANGG